MNIICKKYNQKPLTVHQVRLYSVLKKTITLNSNTTNNHLYHYAGNSPIKYTDPDGKAINFLAGAIAGALVSGGINVAFQLASNGGDISKINGTELAGSMVSGAVAGAITSGGSAIASVTTGIASRAVVIATGTVAGAIGNGVDTITQNVFDGDTSTAPMDGIGPSLIRGGIAGTVGGLINVAHGDIPNVSVKAPSYITNRPEATSAATKAAVISTTRAVGEGARDAGINILLERTIVPNE
ncbi:hypothetical protein LQZ19_02905 [Treponema primitia]|uniref:hypothetical protein n=1 Tax=Treponema primitia TaxID=88058 RepID=UPI00397FF786